jgi:uncharacterized Ntn-hydrolase superfamily protein
VTIDAGALLGLPVCADGVRLGTVGAVWVDRDGAALGMEVTSAWSAVTHYLPYGAASVRDGAVRTSSLTILAAGPTSFFAEHGARRVAATEAVGFATVGCG